MDKDFGGWHVKKLAINKLVALLHFYEGEIWWASIGHNIGNEEDGKGARYTRPVLIIYKFNSSLFFGVPLSTTKRSGKYYYSVGAGGVPNKALLSQLRAFDARRLLNKLDVITNDKLIAVQDALIEILQSHRELNPPREAGEGLSRFA